MDNYGKEKLALVEKTADDKLAADIKVIHFDEQAGICDAFVIMTGRNTNHTQALSDALEEALEKVGFEVYRKEGFREGSWIVLDLGEIIVHIFTENQRNFYNLEGLWDSK